MKIVKKQNGGTPRELLLKEYFLNAVLIGALKRVGEGVARRTSLERVRLEPARARAQRRSRDA